MKQLTPEQRAFQHRSKLILGKEVSDGGDCIVYQLQGIPNRVVKIVRYDQKNQHKRALKIIRYLQGSKNPTVVKIYDMGSFTFDHGQRCYYYVMEKLKPIPKSMIWRDSCDGYVAEIRDRLLDNRRVSPKNPKKIKHFVIFLETASLVLADKKY